MSENKQYAENFGSTECYDSVPRSIRKPVNIAADLVRIGDENHALHAEAAKCLMRLECEIELAKKKIKELESVLCGGVCNFQDQPCGECEQCKKVREVLASA